MMILPRNTFIRSHGDGYTTFTRRRMVMAYEWRAFQSCVKHINSEQANVYTDRRIFTGECHIMRNVSAAQDNTDQITNSTRRIALYNNEQLR